jgi:hypothetical protein
LARQLTPDECAELRRFAETLAVGKPPSSGLLTLRIVWRHLGWRSAYLMSGALLGARRYRRLPGPAWVSEQARRFIPLAALYRRVRISLGAERAEALARELLLKLGLLEWAHLLPLAEARKARPAEFMAVWRSRIKPAMGAHSDDELELRGRAEVLMTVRRCMFVQVFEALSLAELAPYLCQTDTVYLGALAPQIGFSREGAITEGHPRCVFRFQFAVPDDGKRTAKPQFRNRLLALSAKGSLFEGLGIIF